MCLFKKGYIDFRFLMQAVARDVLRDRWLHCAAQKVQQDPSKA